MALPALLALLGGAGGAGTGAAGLGATAGLGGLTQGAGAGASPLAAIMQQILSGQGNMGMGGGGGGQSQLRSALSGLPGGDMVNFGSPGQQQPMQDNNAIKDALRKRRAKLQNAALGDLALDPNEFVNKLFLPQQLGQ